MEVLQLLVQHGTTPDYATDSDSTDSGSHHHQCTCHQGLRNNRKGSECSLTGSDSCASSCESDCHSSGNSSDSGVHHEPFYLHPPAAAENEKKQKNSKNAFFMNPLNDLKEASEKHSKNKGEAGKSGSSSGDDDKNSNKEPFYLHQPEDVAYHRVQEVFGGKSGRGSVRQSDGGKNQSGGRNDSRKSSQPLEYAKPNSDKKGKVNYEGRELPKIPTGSASPVKVKADIHSSDDAASTASNSSMENHYEDIDPARMGREDRSRQSFHRRGRSLKESSSRDPPPPPAGPKEDREEDEDSVEERQRQRLQELDDLIAGVPPPDYDVRRPLQDGSASSDVRASGRSGSIPPPPEFGDVSSDSRSDDSIAGHRRLHSTHSVPHHSSSSSSPSPSSSSSQQRSPLMRTASEPSPPPPPPLPIHTPSPRSSPAVIHRSSHQFKENSSPRSSTSSHDSSPRIDSRNFAEGLDEESVVKPSEFIRRNSQRGENGSFRGHKKVDRPVSLPLDVAEHYGKIMASNNNNNNNKPPSTTQDDSSSVTLPAKPHLTQGKSLPFILPKFPSQPSGSGLIKPSEYLKSLGGTSNRSPMGADVKSLVAMHSSESLSSSFDSPHEHSNGHTHSHDTQPASMPPGPLPSIPEATEEEASKINEGAPPPPPAPPAPPTSASPAPPTASSTNTLNRSNTLNGNSKSMLPTISVTDLQSVQLRKTEAKVAKTTSVPIRIPLSSEPALAVAKDDVIAELKKGVDITGIKKLKSERMKEEAKTGKIEKEELEKQFSAVNFVDQIAERDNAGNRIPEWKRQMLARKAAERAKKEAEEKFQQQLEEKRLQSIPAWKRQLLMRRDDDGKRNPLYIPKVEEGKKIHVVNSPQDITRLAQKNDLNEDAKEGQQVTEVQDVENGSSPENNPSRGSSSPEEKEEEEEEPLMPWRTNLRKTRSKLSLLE